MTQLSGNGNDGVITSWNHAAEKIYGYSVEDVVGKPLSPLCFRSRTRDAGHLFAAYAREPVARFETNASQKAAKFWMFLLPFRRFVNDHARVVVFPRLLVISRN